MKRWTLWMGAIVLIAGCAQAQPKEIIIEPAPREITSPDHLPVNLLSKQIYWQEQFFYLDGTPVREEVPELIPEYHKGSGLYSNPKLSHNQQYLAYSYGVFNRIGIWNASTKTQQELINSEEDLRHNANISGFSFMPDDKKVIFKYSWHNDANETNIDLATVDIGSKEIQYLDIEDAIPATGFDIDISRNQEWVAFDTSTLTKQACILINLSQKTIHCFTYKEGWYSSIRFTPDSQHIVYDHTEKIFDRTNLTRSKIDGTENITLASGFDGTEILLVTNEEIVFAGDIFPESNCSNVFVINQDGSDLRLLEYFDKQCFTNE